VKLILTFQHEHHSKDISSEVICIEGPAVDVVKDSLKALIENTTAEHFQFCGREFYVRDFRSGITHRQLAHAEMLAEHLNNRMPYTFNVRGEPHTFKKFAVQTLEAWFEKQATTFVEPAELVFAH
jgi:hypothetical protein